MEDYFINLRCLLVIVIPVIGYYTYRNARVIGVKWVRFNLISRNYTGYLSEFTCDYWEQRFRYWLPRVCILLIFIVCTY